MAWRIGKTWPNCFATADIGNCAWKVPLSDKQWQQYWNPGPTAADVVALGQGLLRHGLGVGDGQRLASMVAGAAVVVVVEEP